MKKLLLILLLVSTFSFGQTFLTETFDNSGQCSPFDNCYPITYSFSQTQNFSISNTTWNGGSCIAPYSPSDIPNSSGNKYVKLLCSSNNTNSTTTSNYMVINNLNTNNNQINKLSIL